MPKRKLKGEVVQNSADKTISVLVTKLEKHKRYHKVVKSFKKYAAHDDVNDAKIGDLVEIEECRPYSKSKTWKLVSVLQRAV